jgi:hypothetical protein
MRIFASDPMTFNLTLSTRSSDKEVVKEGIYTAINQLIGTSSDKAVRKITRELSDKAEETALTIEEIACKYYPAENYLICQMFTSDRKSSILGQFEVSQYEEKVVAPLSLRDIVNTTLNCAVRDTLLKLFGRFSR